MAKLSYEAVGAWLDEKGTMPPEVASVPGMDAADSSTVRSCTAPARITKRAWPRWSWKRFRLLLSLTTEGRVIDLAVTNETGAHLIENFMIAANVAMAQFPRGRVLDPPRRAHARTLVAYR